MYEDFMLLIKKAKEAYAQTGECLEVFAESMVYLSDMPAWRRWGYYAYTYTWIKNKEQGREIRVVYRAYFALIRIRLFIWKTKLKRLIRSIW